MKTPAPGKGGRLGESSSVGSASEDTAPTRHSDMPAQRSLFDPPDDVPANPDVLAGRDQAERNADQWWMEIGLQAIRAIAKTGDEFQAFDLVQRYHIPEPDTPQRWGPLLASAAREGLIVATGAAPSRRPSTARSLTRTWRGVAS